MWTWRYDGLLNDRTGQNSKHIYLGETRLVTKIGRADGSFTNEEKLKQYWYHSDHLGSAQLITNVEGEEYERIEYTPYGELWVERASAASNIDIPYRFTGKERDEETGLYYYGARYLDSKTSRWLSADPALGEYIPASGGDNFQLPGMGGIYNYVNMHLYHYAGNNPIRYTDPTGLADEDATRTLEYNQNQDSASIRTLEFNSPRDNTEIALLSGNGLMIFPEDNRSFWERVIGKDEDQYIPYILNPKTGEYEKIQIVTGTPPNAFPGTVGIIGLIKGLFKAKNVLTVAKGVDITLKSGQIGQVIIQNNKIVGFSTKYLKHIEFAKALGLDPTKVVGATVFQKGAELIVAPSASIPSAGKEILGLLYNLLH
jgi:RHS repeat-associated protein